MRLIELTANQETFRSVRFNETGLTLIVGRKSDPKDKNREHSTNGVGKSLLLYLVSFCLGSKKNKALKEALPDWEFTLSFEHAGENHCVIRSTEDQGFVVFDSDRMSLTKYTALLGRTVFSLSEEPVKHLTFRSLLSLFLRVEKPAYESENQAARNERKYTQQIRGAYLLGLDEHLVDTKRELREEHDRLESIRKQFKKDSFLREYFHGDHDVDLELTDLDEEISRLKTQAAEFRVAENYDEIASQAENTRREWQRTKNELNSLESSKRQIEASLIEQPDVSTDDVQRMYEQATVQLPDTIKKRLDEVNDFHQCLVDSRCQRLTSEKHNIERRIDELKETLAKLDAAKDEYYQFLGSHGALQEYEALHNSLADCQRRADRLREFQLLEQDCQERLQKNKLQMSQENIRTTDYLKSGKTLTESINDRFRSMARRIWPKHTCGLVVRNNEGENMVRFDIEAKIQTDASDGVSETKIFCFDMTVLLERQHHTVNFLMHDNRLYQGIDPRQCAELFRIADELCHENKCQYIASLNDAYLDSMRGVFEDSAEFDSLFTSNTVLELTDDSHSGKLLGVTVDFLYDSSRKHDE